MSSQAPHLQKGLNPGATEEELALLSETVTAALPEDFQAFYRIHNGQSEMADYLIDGEELLSTARIIAEWTVWNEGISNGQIAGKSKPDEGIRDHWWNPLWIPVTYDGSGNHYCLDLDPAEGGQWGQIIRMWHDDPRRELIAPSFGEWMEQYVTATEAGEYVFLEDYAAVMKKPEEEV
jgi:cell wall assembly regulator SMI1